MAKAYTLVGGQGGSEYTGANPIIPETSDIVIAKDTYFAKDVTVMGDSDLVSGNIKDGVDIFGVTGRAVAVENVGGNGTAYLYQNGYSTYKITNVMDK